MNLTDKNVWMAPRIEGLSPLSRGHHTATVIASKMYIIGGGANWDGQLQENKDYFSDVWELDFEELTK
jgi:hypothetical protein